MMRAQNNFSLLFSSLLLVSSSVFATSVITTAPGGDPTTGYQATAPTFADGDIIRGHTIFKAGFTMPASATVATVTWDGDGIVNGTLTRNANTVLSLASDLRLGSTAFLVGTDTLFRIKGNGNSVKLGGDLILAADRNFSVDTNNLIIDGQGHILSYPSSTKFTPNGTTTITLKNMLFTAYDSANNGGLFGAMGVVLENMSVAGGKSSLSNWTTLGNATTSFTIRGRVALNMPGRRLKLNYNSAVNIIIEKNSTLYVGKRTILEAINTADGGSITFTMADQTSVLHLDGCDFYTGANGLSLTKGTVIFENKVRIFNKNYDGASNADMTKALIFGDGTAAGDVNVRVLGGAYVVVDGCMKDYHS